MATKKRSTTGLKDVKEDLLKVFTKLDLIEQHITNLSVKVRRLEDRVGVPR
tara:strand:- start:46 stop:198 length:153 start_codon:yes stop_codon:yes gene_type:complete